MTLNFTVDLTSQMILRLPRNCFCINLSSLELIKILFPIEGQLWSEAADWWTAKDAREIQRTIKSMCDNEQETPYRKGEWWMMAWTLYPKMLSVCHCCGSLSYVTEYFKVGLFRRFMVWQLEFFLAWTLDQVSRVITWDILSGCVLFWVCDADWTETACHSWIYLRCCSPKSLYLSYQLKYVLYYYYKHLTVVTFPF